MATTLWNEKHVLWQIEDDTCNPIALLGNDKEANAQFIVTACNGYAELLEACKRAKQRILELHVGHDEGYSQSTIAIINNALRKAEGKG